jgi:hypothetical protein
MFPRELALRLGGYDPSLRANKVEGCEDFLLYARLAASGDVVCVPDHLIGYRHSPGNMSSNTERMWKSQILALTYLEAELPRAEARIIPIEIADLWLSISVLFWRAGRRGDAVRALKPALDGAGALAGARKLRTWARNRLARRPEAGPESAVRPRFSDFEAGDGDADTAQPVLFAGAGIEPTGAVGG